MTEPAQGLWCPHCDKPMEPPLTARSNYYCRGCGRYGSAGETPEDIEDRERGKQNALRLLEEAMAYRGVDWDEHRKDGEVVGGIQTRDQPCPKCGGTMWKTVEVDDDGNETGETQYVCGDPSCGHVE